MKPAAPLYFAVGDHCVAPNTQFASLPSVLEVRRIGTDGVTEDLGVHVLFFERALQQQGLVEVSAVENDVRIYRFDAADDGGNVGRAGRILVVVDDLHAVRRGVIRRALSDFDGERVVGGRDRDRFRRRLHRPRHLKDALEILEARCEHGKRVFVALVENARGGSVALNHRHLQALDDRSRRGGVRRAVRPKDKIHFVLGDESFDQARRGLGIGLVVGVLDVDLIGLAADLHSAVRVDVVFPKLVPFFGQYALACIRARGGKRRAEDDRIVGRSGRARNGGREGERSRNRECKETAHANKFHLNPPNFAYIIVRIREVRADSFTFGAFTLHPAQRAGARRKRAQPLLQLLRCGRQSRQRTRCR